MGRISVWWMPKTGVDIYNEPFSSNQWVLSDRPRKARLFPSRAAAMKAAEHMARHRTHRPQNGKSSGTSGT